MTQKRGKIRRKAENLEAKNSSNSNSPRSLAEFVYITIPAFIHGKFIRPNPFNGYLASNLFKIRAEKTRITRTGIRNPPPFPLAKFHSYDIPVLLSTDVSISTYTLDNHTPITIIRETTLLTPTFRYEISRVDRVERGTAERKIDSILKRREMEGS